LRPTASRSTPDLILDKLIDLKADGSFRLDMQYFNYCTGLTMTNQRFADAVWRPAAPGGDRQVTQREMDLAASIQAVTEEVVLRLARSLHQPIPAKRTSAWPAVWHSTVWPTAACCVKVLSEAPVDPAGGR
jgi:predicted NodU family carbamoyl transferase